MGAMNILNVSLQHSILTLAASGWSQRRIALELGVHRETVGKYLRLAESKPAISTLGSQTDPTPKPAILTLGSDGCPDPKPAISTHGAGRPSTCKPWREQIEKAVALGLSAQRIYQDLVSEHGFRGNYQAVKRFVRTLRQSQPEPFARIEVLPGTEAQVDFGQGAWVTVEGKRKRPHLFRIVLSHSRKGYSEVVWRQSTENFIRALENAFRHFGGVPQTLVIDNLRAAVKRTDWFEPELNRKVEEFCRHYGTVILPTRPAMPRHKGKIEAGIKYAQNNALRGRSFESLAAQNLFLADWERTVADTRLHGTIRQQVGRVFQAVERAALLPLPASLFPCFEEALRCVHRDGYIEVQRAYYSVPPEYVGRQVWVPRTDRRACAHRAGPVRHRSATRALALSAHRSARFGLPVGPGAPDRQAYRQLGRSDGSTARSGRPASVARALVPGGQTSGRGAGKCRPKGAAPRHLAVARFAHLARTGGSSPATGLPGDSPFDPATGRLRGADAGLLQPSTPIPP
jgi:transposase